MCVGYVNWDGMHALDVRTYASEYDGEVHPILWPLIWLRSCTETQQGLLKEVDHRTYMIQHYRSTEQQPIVVLTS